MKNRSQYSITLILMATTLLLLVACVPPARLLVNVDLGMSKNEVKQELGSPEGLRLSFKAPNGKLISVWDYRLAQYEMATTLSPYFNIYGLFFENGELIRIEKLETNARLSEKAALKILGYPDVVIDLK